MATVKFLLRNTSSNKDVSINYYINLSAHKKIRGATSYKVNPKYWDSKKQIVRNKIEVSHIRDRINQRLSDFKSFVFEKLIDYRSNDPDQIYSLLKKDIKEFFRGNETENKDIGLFSYIDKFIDQSKGRIIERTGRTISPCTIREYRNTKKLLINFQNNNSSTIDFDTINLDFYYDFKEYLESMGYSINTIGKFIKHLKTFLNAATDEGVNKNLSFRNKRFIKPTVESVQIYLDECELQKIMELDLSKRPELENARDLFLIGAYTGLRVSDYSDLSQNNIFELKGKRFFRLTVKKTGKYLPIPIHPVIEHILLKNNGKLPGKMPAQRINMHLKEIGKIAGIDEPITIETSKGGTKVKKVLPKYDMIANHTARRSFCTNAYRSGMPTIDIMAISGHSSERTFLKYIKISAEDRALKIADSTFFKGK